MTRPVVIRARNLGKRYQRVHEPPMLLRDMAAMMSGQRRRVDDFWALRDVSFELNAGDALGIIGPNGAGKSTILRLLTRILRPTHGSCSAAGRIGALIEVGAGFHPDLTGRENIYLQGAIMGMGQREIAQKFDQIVAFSGIEWFLDTPVKRYSSGMHARLGFSIAAHLDPDVLIIDEVLSVGDASFQRKAFARVTELVQRAIPVIVVSHQLDAIATFCTQAMLLDAGSVIQRGMPLDCISTYLQRSERAPAAEPAGVLLLERLSLEPGDSMQSGEDVTVAVSCAVSSGQARGSLGVGVRLRAVESGLVVFETTTFHLHETLPNTGAFTVAWDLQLNVHSGMYVVETFVWNGMSGREVGSGLTAYVRISGRDESSGPVQMNPRIRVSATT